MATDNIKRSQVGWGFWLWRESARTVGFRSRKVVGILPLARWIDRWRIKLLVQKSRDTLRGIGGRTKRPEHLYGGLHELDLRDVFRIVEPQELDNFFVGDRSFHRTLSLLPE